MSTRRAAMATRPHPDTQTTRSGDGGVGILTAPRSHTVDRPLEVVDLVGTDMRDAIGAIDVGGAVHPPDGYQVRSTAITGGLRCLHRDRLPVSRILLVAS